MPDGHRENRDAEDLEHDPEKWIPIFGKRSRFNKNLERDTDSAENHRALAEELGAEFGLPPHALVLEALKFAQAERKSFRAYLSMSGGNKPPPASERRRSSSLGLPVSAELFTVLMFLLGVVISAILVLMGG
jgi:hypothetical protein